MSVGVCMWNISQWGVCLFSEGLLCFSLSGQAPIQWEATFLPGRCAYFQRAWSDSPTGTAGDSMCSASGTCPPPPLLLLHFDRFHNKLLVKVFWADNTESLWGGLAALAQLRGCLEPRRQQPRAAVCGVEWTAPAPRFTGHWACHRGSSESCLRNCSPQWLLQTLHMDLLWTSWCLQTISHWERRVWFYYWSFQRKSMHTYSVCWS